MAMGRGNATNLVILGLLFLACATSQILAETYVVGGSNGWGFSISYDSWTNGKTFAAGDTLVFNYQASVHNVMPVSAEDYRSCKASNPSKAATTGKDKFELKKGPNYFICSIPGHCAAGMKIRVVAN